MKRTVFSVLASLIVAGTLLGAQNAPAQDQPASAPQAPPAQAPAPGAARPSQDSADDTTLKGCLIQGSSPTTFILDNATPETAAAGAKGQRFVVEISAQPDQIKSILNSHVQIVGTADSKAAASAAPSDDKKKDDDVLPKFTAKRITRIAATCPA
jgi:hypothetical protein